MTHVDVDVPIHTQAHTRRERERENATYPRNKMRQNKQTVQVGRKQQEGKQQSNTRRSFRPMGRLDTFSNIDISTQYHHMDRSYFVSSHLVFASSHDYPVSEPISCRHLVPHIQASSCPSGSGGSPASGSHHPSSWPSRMHASPSC